MTREQRITRAVEAVERHKIAYYDSGAYRGADFWDFAEIFEIIDDLYEVTGDRSYFAMLEEMHDFVIRTYGFDWKDNPFNDDIMWMVIAFTRAYLFTGEKKYLDIAEFNYKNTFDRAMSDDLGGGLFWQIENQTKNTCVNCPAAVAAGYLAKATGDESYYDKLFYCLDWVMRRLFQPDTGKVYDSYDMSERISTWSSTYNQGTFIGSCLAYYEHTGDEIWLHHAEMAAKYTRDTMYQRGIMDNEETGNDLPGFKGILARYIRRFADVTGKTEYMDWLRENADAAWNNRNAKGIMCIQLAHRTAERDDLDVFAVSAAVSVVVNAAGSRSIEA